MVAKDSTTSGVNSNGSEGNVNSNDIQLSRYYLGMNEVHSSDEEDEDGEQDDDPSTEISVWNDRRGAIRFKSFIPCASSDQGESFCSCFRSPHNYVVCNCGEEDRVFEWEWDSKSKSAAATLASEDREVKFHAPYSCGTAAVRGTRPMTNYQYYWEVKMTTPVYGTDMMVGIGTEQANLSKFRFTFGSLLGDDCESWGFSYTGNVQHKGQFRKYSTRFGHGSIIGVHLNMWNGTMTFFKNRIPLGVAYRGLQGKTLYPMVCSTAARSGMKIIRCRSFRSSLQFICCMKLRECIPRDLCVLDVLKIPPGLKAYLQNNLDWLLCANTSTRDSSGAYNNDDNCQCDTNGCNKKRKSDSYHENEPSSKRFRKC